jgi:hypothetical protein
VAVEESPTAGAGRNFQGRRVRRSATRTFWRTGKPDGSIPAGSTNSFANGNCAGNAPLSAELSGSRTAEKAKHFRLEIDKSCCSGQLQGFGNSRRWSPYIRPLPISPFELLDDWPPQLLLAEKTIIILTYFRFEVVKFIFAGRNSGQHSIKVSMRKTANRKTLMSRVRSVSAIVFARAEMQKAARNGVRCRPQLKGFGS